MARKTIRDKRQKEQNGPKKKAGSFSERWRRFKLTLVHNRTNLRSLALVFAFSCIAVFTASGFTHAHHVQQVRAMTVSAVNKTLTFSKTGNTARLEPQFRHGDLTVIPIKFDSNSSFATSASKYKVFFKESISKYKIPTIKTSFVVFGSTGYAAIMVYGDLPKAPLQILIRDDMPISTVDFNDNSGDVDNSNGTGKVDFDGRRQKVNFDATAFRINPKGNNVKTDKSISRTMSMSQLYSVIAGKERIAKAKKHLTRLNYAQSQNLKAEHQYYSQLEQINKALGRPADDTQDDSDSDSANANTTLENNRQNILSNIETCQSNTEQYTDTVQSAKADLQQTKILEKSMDGYATASSRYGVFE